MCFMIHEILKYENVFILIEMRKQYSQTPLKSPSNVSRAFFHHFGTMTHTPGIGNFSVKMPKNGNFLVLLAVLSNHKIHHTFI